MRCISFTLCWLNKLRQKSFFTSSSSSQFVLNLVEYLNSRPCPKLFNFDFNLKSTAMGLFKKKKLSRVSTAKNRHVFKRGRCRKFVARISFNLEEDSYYNSLESVRTFDLIIGTFFSADAVFARDSNLSFFAS